MGFEIAGRKKIGMSNGGLLVLLLICTMVLVACKGGGKSSSVEGKLVDWNNKPVAGVKITASQVQPIKGYEQFEAVTGADGSFTLKGLFPSSAYVLKPWSDKWTTETKAKVDSAPQGETAVLPQAIQIQNVFTKTEPKLIADIATGKPAIASIKGKLVDWNGNPVKGITIIASSQQSMKGGERFETVTENEGLFSFPELLVSTTYVLQPTSDKWSCKDNIRIETLPHHGDVGYLQHPLQISEALTKNGNSVIDLVTGAVRFQVAADGVIFDSETGLEWAVGPDQDTNYAQAMQWAASCPVAGGGWRIPTRMELKALYQEGVGERNMDPAFQTTGLYVWAEPKDSSLVGYFYFHNGTEGWSAPVYSGDARVFGVRSRPR